MENLEVIEQSISSDLTVTDGALCLSDSATKLILEHKIKEEQLKRQQDELKAESDMIHDILLQAMEQNGVFKISNDALSATYRKPSERVSVDSKALKEKEPMIFALYSKTTPIKSSVSIKISDTYKEKIKHLETVVQ